MRWCSNCLLPDTRPFLRIESDGRCNACHSHSGKENIDWRGREKSFQSVVAHAKRNSVGYDCLIPVSGGKDSTWQTIKCLEYGLKPLAVTWKTPGRTSVGHKNLQNLIALGVDHIDFQVSPKVEAAFMLETFERLGSTGIPMHLALFNIPLSLAIKFNIPLVIWGENSAFEYGADNEKDTGFNLTSDWLKKYGVTHGTTAKDWIGDSLTKNDLVPYIGPSSRELEQAGVRAVFLGYYFEWDPQTTSQIAREHGFVSSDSGARVGYYDYADIDDDFISLHHWLKWHKFGFTRTFDNLSLEIRNGRISRSDAIEYIRSKGDETPHDDIEKFCVFSGITSDQFFAIAEKFRNPEIWRQDRDDRWYIKDFLIPDWKW